MLAALLLNLGQTPAPPPAVAPAHFGGGPFWSRYSYDIEEEKEEVIADEVVSSEIIVDEVVSPNPEVRREEKPRPRPAPVVIDKIEATARAALAVRNQIRAELKEERRQREAVRAAKREAARQEALKVEREALEAKRKDEEQQELLLIALSEL